MVQKNGVLGGQSQTNAEREKSYLDKRAEYLAADLEKETRKKGGEE
jgi:hypothetical protein